MTSRKSFLPALSHDRASPAEARFMIKQERSLLPSPTLRRSPGEKGDRLPGIAARPSSSRKVRRSELMPELMPLVEKKGCCRTPSRCELSPVKIPALQENNGITRKRAPAYMRTQTQSRIPSATTKHSRSPDATRSGRKIGITLPRID